MSTKRFDPQAITERKLNYLTQKKDFQNIQRGGALEQFLEAESESEAEIARYGEYLLQEMKWDTSKNFSSVKHMARLVGKKLNRKHSAIGTIIVSHSDKPENDNTTGTARYINLGESVLSIDQESNYDDNIKDITKTGIYEKALVPWWSEDCYSIPVGSTCTSKSGIVYTVAEKKEIKKWNQYFSDIKKTESSLTNFRSEGGWNYYKYLIVPIVQGVQKTVELGTSDNTAGQSFVVSTLDIEAADSYYTRQFCYIEVETKKGVETWNEVYHLSTTNSTSKSFEINILDDLSGTEIKFGDGVMGEIPEKDAKITLHYLETSGEEGNLVDLYSFNNTIDGVEIPDNLKNSVTVGCQNMWGIIGGKNLETLEEFKRNAETAYENNYEIIHTYTELERKLNQISPVPILKPRLKSYYKSTLINTTNVYKSVIGITGLSGNLTKLNDTEKNIFNKSVNNTINENILSNKEILYVDPNIFSINSNVSIELKNPIVSNNSFIDTLEGYLQERLGKYNLSNIDKYQQVDIIKESLNFSENIASIDTLDLVTYSDVTIDYSQRPVNNINDDYIVILLTTPSLNINVLSSENNCTKGKKDGCDVCLLINLDILNNMYSLVLRDTDSSETYESTSFLTCKNPKNLNLYQRNRYSISQLLSNKFTLSNPEVRFPDSNLNFTDNTYLGKNNIQYIYFNYIPSSQSMSFNLALPKKLVASWLGFDENAETNDVYVELQNTLDNNTSKVSVSFIPTDKTIETSDWNTVIYYDNIEVSIL